MQLFIVLLIIALALAYTLWRLVRTLRGHGDCGCGCGKNCPNCHGRKRDTRHDKCCLLMALVALTAHSAAGGCSVAQMVRDIRLLPNTELHHLVVIKDGQLIAQEHVMPCRATDRHNQFSACKALTALAAGLAIGDGKLSLDTKVVDLFGDKCPASPSDELRALTVRHLLTMTSGKAVTTAIRDTTDDWAGAWLALPGTQPGRQFAYDTMTSFMVSAAVQRATGRTVLDLLTERILRPMGIDDVEWESSPDGITTGGWGLRCSTLSMARIGWLLLQRGQWRGRQLVDGAWVDQMVADQLPSLGIHVTHSDEFQHGYGFQIWRCALDGAYRAQGNYGQLLVVSPSASMVVAVNAVTDNQSELLRVVERDMAHFSGTAGSAVPATTEHCSNRQWPCAPMRLLLADNNHGISVLEVRRQGDTLTLLIDSAGGGRQQVPLGCGQWLYTPLQGQPPYNIGARNRFSGMDSGFTVAARYAVRMGGQLEVQLRYVDWYSAVTLLIDPAARQVVITDNKAPAQPERVQVTNQPVPPRHSGSRWWMAAFALMAVALVTLVVCNRPDKI